jgi:hypothetical protein
VGVNLRNWFLRWIDRSQKGETRELRVVLDKTSFARFERLRTRVLRVDDAKLIDLALKCLEKKIATTEHRLARQNRPPSGERLKLQQRLDNVTDAYPSTYAEGDRRHNEKGASRSAKKREENHIDETKIGG